MTLADRVAVMNHGHIQQLGTPEEIHDDPKNLFVAGFIGSPVMNLVEGAIDDGRFVTEDASIAGVGGDRSGVPTLSGIGSLPPLPSMTHAFAFAGMLSVLV